MRLKFSCITAVAALALAVSANALTISQTILFPNNPACDPAAGNVACTTLAGTANVTQGDKTPITQTLAFTTFNTSLGTLNSITFSIYNWELANYTANSGFSTTVGTSEQFHLTNEVILSQQAAGTNTGGDVNCAAPGGQCQNGTLANPFYDDYINFATQIIGPGTGDVSSQQFKNQTPGSAILDNTDCTQPQGLGVCGTHGSVANGGIDTGGPTVNTFTVTDGNGLNFSAFNGDGVATTNLYWEVLGSQSETGGPQASLSFSNFAGIEIIASYNYSPTAPPPSGVPEPSTMLLLGSGLSFVAAKLRKRMA